MVLKDYNMRHEGDTESGNKGFELDRVKCESEGRYNNTRILGE